MSQFTQHIAISPSSNRGLWINDSDFRYYIGEENSNRYVDVKAGYEFDGASVPFIFGRLIQKTEPDTITSACLHDRLYVNDRRHGRIGSDTIFLESLLVYNIPKLLRDGRRIKAFCMIVKYTLMTMVLFLFSWWVWYRIPERIRHVWCNGIC